MQTRQTAVRPAHRLRFVLSGLLAAGVLVSPLPALAAAPGGPAPALAWGIPFLGVLLSIALVPMLAPRFWHKRMGLVMLFWSLALVVPQALLQGPASAATGVWHAVLIEYLPFVTLLLALYTAGGGILLRNGPGGTPAGNTGLLALGTLMAGIMGTTGAAMVLIHPLLRTNAHRTDKVHLVIFFTLLVANAGGATTPLGDPPLYIGFLRGVPFEWPLLHLFRVMVWVSVPLLVIFYLVDRRLARKDPPPPKRKALRLRGWQNVALILVIVFDVLGQGVFHLSQVDLLGQHLGLERLLGMAVFLVVTAVSLAVTPRAVRAGNDFTWGPMEEIGKLFAAIFITIGPVGVMLAAGFDGPLAALLRLTEGSQGDPLPWVYFWLTGILSAFLDNAPTYLVFFQLAEIDPQHLSGLSEIVLEAISAGAVFFGALTYIGNAPNMMVRSIAAHRGVRMPGFFGYLVWSSVLLLPIFVLVTLRFFVWY